MQAIFARYQKEVSPDPADLRTVGKWAMDNSLWHPKPADVQASFARDMADALQEETRIDKAGRPYRAKIAARVSNPDGGTPLFKWADIDLAPRSHAEKSFQQTRQQVAATCFHLRMGVDHFNAIHPEQPPIPLLLDFSEDVEEMMISRGVKDDAA
jgi:hypothetical protein